MNDTRERIHIYPVDRYGRSSHCTDKTGMCGCKPEVKQPCPESDEVTGKCKAECWRCAGTGLVEPFCDEWALLIIHKKENKLCYPAMNDTDLNAV